MLQFFMKSISSRLKEFTVHHFSFINVLTIMSTINLDKTANLTECKVKDFSVFPPLYTEEFPCCEQGTVEHLCVIVYLLMDCKRKCGILR